MAKINWTLRTFRLDELTDYYKNPRSLSEKEFKQLKKSLDTFGMIDKPIVNLDSANTIIGGHQRKHVLEATGVKECECWIPDRELSEREVEELNIRLNKNTGSWDFDTLANEFELGDLLDWGFDKGELDLDLWADDAPEDVEPQIDKAEELRVKWGVETGQLWQLGEHRLICGDSTNKDNIQTVLGAEKWQLGFTSPPYNSGDADFTYDYKAKKEGGFYDGGKDDLSIEEYKDLCFGVLNNYASFADDTHCLFWNVMYNANSRDTYGKIVFSENNPFMVRETIIWNKIGGFPVAGTNILSRNSELIFLLSLNEKYLSNQTLKDCIYWNRWDISNSNSQQKDLKHKACFPVELPSKAIEDFSKEGHIVLDLFSGSGTTLIACERLGRKCRAVEISPAYVAVAIQRWVDVTGNEPVLLDT